MTVIQVEHVPLKSAGLLYRDLGHRVRVAYDTAHLTEPQALALLYVQLPRLAAEQTTVHHAVGAAPRS
ncbi:hypothetical protein ACFV5N_21180 [Streptomyces sp. NPDC059853]|uniref:hypothetical protein n=1 Tax=Streptomyces sp. NPDC059853 TaxID=3346973 RepID=UPI00364FDAF1